MSHLEYTRQLTARQMIEYIAGDYHEMSHDKIKWQRDSWKRECQDWLEHNSEGEKDENTI